MSLASISIRNPVFAWMLMFGFIVFGYVGFTRLPVGQYPDVDIPNINISATLEGAAPEIMESDVADVIEDAVMAVEGIREITSTCRQGSAQINVEFNIERDIDLALQDVQARISQAQRNLPADLDAPIIRKTNPEENPIMWVALSGTRSQQEISEYAKNVLRDKFLTVDGNGDVMMGGYLQRNVRIWLKAEALESRGLAADDVLGALQREHVEAPAGRMEGSMREANVRVEGEALNVEAMRNILITTQAGSPVYLKDVALVEDGFEDRRRIARSNGYPAQGMGIIKQHGANTVEVAEAVHKRLDEIRATLPEGLSLDIRTDDSKPIKEAIHEIYGTLTHAILLTAIVCWLFLGALSPTLNVILAIPVSVFGTFAVMYFLGFSLNTFTLLAISLSVGIVVDDAVMVLENIYRHAEMGKDKVRAAREGTEQITFAALAATLSIIAIFLPVAFMSGIIGKFFLQFGVVLSVAVAISLLEALTLAPARCSQFLRVGHRSNFIERAAGKVFGGLSSVYRAMLTRVLHFRTKYVPAGSLLVLGISGLAFFASMYVAGWLKSEMMPAQDLGYYRLRVETPVGSTIDYTDKVMKGIEEILATRDEIASTLIIVGAGGPGTSDVSSGMGFITLKPRSERKLSQQQSREEVRALTNNKFPGVRINFADAGGLPGERGGGAQIDFSIRGDDWETLGDVGDKFADEMRASGMFTDVTSSYKKGMPEVQIIPNREKTLAHNVDMRRLTETVSALVGGQRVAKFKDAGRRYDIRMRLLKDDRSRPEDIASLYIRSKDGKLVRLGDVADIVTKPSLQNITRLNRQRAVKITANPAPGFAQGEAIVKVNEMAAGLLPPGYNHVFSGATKAFQESRDSLVFAMVLGLIVAYMVLASQFNSFVHPVTVLLSMPFSLSGAFIALYFTGQTLNIYSMIGIILLLGIVKKNSILLVDYTNQLKDEGKKTDEALIEACPIRLRPILMTTCATVAGAIPAAISLGPGGELRIPMAVSIIGGLILSTFLTLLVVPCFYSIVDEIRGYLGFSGKTHAVPADAPVAEAAPAGE
ncbi:MAG TPA: efflux RND transporter permease subunit [Planctomycetota bacterium]|nr:efflux RND transporter permease subunit [Planctomycetota bacterium]